MQKKYDKNVKFLAETGLWREAKVNKENVTNDELWIDFENK